MTHPTRARTGLTLFEVAISTLVLTVAVLSAMALLPRGIEAERDARSKVFAASVFLTLMDDFHKMQTDMAGAQDRAVVGGDPAAKADFVHFVRSYAGPDRIRVVTDVDGSPIEKDPDGETKRSNYGTIADDAAISRRYPYQDKADEADGRYIDLIQLLMDGDLDPCFGIGIHNANYYANCHSADFEQYLSSRLGGLIPIPPEIARRIEDPTGEMQRLLDADGYLYYLDPNHVRGFADSSRTPFVSSNPQFQSSGLDSSAQNLVIGVVGPAQQNILPANPWESWPFYEMYPFPPQFIRPTASNAANVYECVYLGSSTDGDEGTVATDLNGVPPKEADDGYKDEAQNDIHYGRGEYLGIWVKGSDIGPYLDHTTADPDVVRAAAESMLDNGGYHGANWRYFKQQEERFLEKETLEVRKLWWRSDLQDLYADGLIDHHGYSRHKWTAGWDAFRLMAGNPNAGWYVAGLSGVTGALYDYQAEAYEDDEDWLWYHPWMVDLADAKGYGPGNPPEQLYNNVQDDFGVPGTWGHTWTFQDVGTDIGNGEWVWGYDNKGKHDYLAGIKWNLQDVTESVSANEDVFPTFEMRTTYRDYALRLWDAVRPRPELRISGSTLADYDPDLDPFSVTTEARVVEDGAWQHADGSGNQTSSPAVAEMLLVNSPFSLDFNAMRELDRIGVPGWRLDGFNVIDPNEVPKFNSGATGRYALDSSIFTGDLEHEFPPHPAQVLALSYLAHAANMVAAWTPPFERIYYDPHTVDTQTGSSFTAKEQMRDPDLLLAEPIQPYWLSYEPDAADGDGLVERDVKLAATDLFFRPEDRGRVLLMNNTTAREKLSELVGNIPDPQDINSPGYLNPAVLPGKRETFAQRTMVFHPGDCIAFELELTANQRLERKGGNANGLVWVDEPTNANAIGYLVYELGPIRELDLDGDGEPENLRDLPLPALRSTVIEPQNNNETVRQAYVDEQIGEDDPRLRWLYIRRVYLATHEHGYVDLTAESLIEGWAGGPFQEILDWSNPPDELSARVMALKRHIFTTTVCRAVAGCPGQWTTNWGVSPDLLDDHANPEVGFAIAYSGRAIRVASPADIGFARKSHEMCMRWAVSYARENPYDWGAPRPANSPTAWDKPLTMFNIFDASDTAREPPSDFVSQASKSTQPFHPWITPVNPQARRYRMREPYRPGADANSSEPPSDCYRISHFGPFDRPNASPPIGAAAEVPTTVWDTIYNNHLIRTADGQRDASSRAERFWPLRGFHPRDRCRQVVFWSAPWKDYEDAEMVPSAPVDSEQHAAKYWGGEGGFDSDWGVCKEDIHEKSYSHHDVVFPRVTRSEGQTRWATVEQLVFHPELGSMWNSAARTRTTAFEHEISDADLDTNRSWHNMLGIFGADRNFNGSYDRGPIRSDNTIQATEVARFNFYDPIVRLNAEN